MGDCLAHLENLDLMPCFYLELLSEECVQQTPAAGDTGDRTAKTNQIISRRSDRRILAPDSEGRNSQDDRLFSIGCGKRLLGRIREGRTRSRPSITLGHQGGGEDPPRCLSRREALELSNWWLRMNPEVADALLSAVYECVRVYEVWEYPQKYTLLRRMTQWPRWLEVLWRPMGS